MALEIYRGNVLVLAGKLDKEYYNNDRIIRLY